VSLKCHQRWASVKINDAMHLGMLCRSGRHILFEAIQASQGNLTVGFLASPGWGWLDTG